MTTAMWIVFGVLALVGLLTNSLLHECAHALVFAICGGQIVEFKPWPHIKDNKKWCFGRVRYYIPPDSKVTKGQWMLIHSAPAIKGLLLSAVWFCLMFWVYPPFMALLLWQLMDVFWFLIGYSFFQSSDGGKFRKLVGGHASR